MRTTRLTVRGNYVHDNLGVGHRQRQRQHRHRLREQPDRGQRRHRDRGRRRATTTLIRNNTIRRNGFALHRRPRRRRHLPQHLPGRRDQRQHVDRNLQGIGIFSTDRGSGPHGTLRHQEQLRPRQHDHPPRRRRHRRSPATPPPTTPATTTASDNNRYTALRQGIVRDLERTGRLSVRVWPRCMARGRLRPQQQLQARLLNAGARPRPTPTACVRRCG